MLGRPTFLAAVMVSSPMIAMAWSHEIERGLDLYRTPLGPTVVSLVCDPRGVYDGDESAVLMEIGGFCDYSGWLTIAFPNGSAVDVAMVHGRIGKLDLEPDIWAAILQGFSAHDALSVTLSAGEVHRVEAGEPLSFTCV